ncbi:MAG: AAA family ATPase, partial [Gemmatimonadetes bacterium]|nr:AAA family ATPase [Gemmatimonadota bacterium]
MSLKIESITLERFRAFRELTIRGLGGVNLITGKNNTGKSSVLEGLRLLANDATPDVIYDILRYREENIEEAEEEGHPTDPDSLFLFSGLFHGFPLLSEDPELIAISTSGKSSPMSMTIHLDWVLEEPDSDGTNLVLLDKPEPDGIAALRVETQDATRIHRLDRFGRYLHPMHRARFKSSNGTRMPCIFVSPYSGESTGALGPLWDKIALSDRE